MARSRRWAGAQAFHLAGLVIAGALFSSVALAQNDACRLIPDKRDPADLILRCGDRLTVKPAPGASYRPVPGATQYPDAVQLDSGAILIEYHRDKASKEGRGGFQILAPHAIAAVRGTRWAMEVQGGRTSCVVLSGIVAVSSRATVETVTLTAGDGVDVTAAPGPLKVNRWGIERVSALLSRFK